MKTALSEEYGEGWKEIVEKAASNQDQGGDYMSATTFGRGSSSSAPRFNVNLSASSAWDTQNIIGVIQRHWNDVFAAGNRWLTNTDRNLLFEARNCRNKWAHQNHFTLRDTYRYIDSIQRLLELIPEKSHEWEEVDKMRNYVLLYLANEVKRESKKKKEEKHAKSSKPSSSSSSKNVSHSSPEYHEEEQEEEEEYYNSNISYNSSYNNSNLSFSSKEAEERLNSIYSSKNYHDSDYSSPQPQQQPSIHHQNHQHHNISPEEELIQKFSSLSGLTREFTVICLSEANYNPEKAWELYVNARESGKIPPHAWLNK